MIQRSNQLQKDHHPHHSIANLKEIDSLVLEKQKRKKSQLHDERERLNKRRRKQYRVKVKMNTATEVKEFATSFSLCTLKKKECTYVLIGSKGAYKRLHARI